MKVELILNDDLELKTYIKELIKNEIINISRTEIKETVTNELNKKISNTFTYSTNLDKLIEQEVVRQVSNYLRGYWASYSSEYLFTYIDSKIKNHINKYLTNLGLKTLEDINNAK